MGTQNIQTSFVLIEKGEKRLQAKAEERFCNKNSMLGLA